MKNSIVNEINYQLHDYNQATIILYIKKNTSLENYNMTIKLIFSYNVLKVSITIIILIKDVIYAYTYTQR